MYVYIYIAGKTMPFLPPMTGNCLFIPPIKMVMIGIVFLFFNNIYIIDVFKYDVY